LLESKPKESCSRRPIDKMNDQQWEFWEYDASSWDHYADHETASMDDDGDHRLQPQFPIQQKPITSLSSVLAEEEDSKHLFAASMFRSSLRNSDEHLQSDDKSVDSDSTARISNRNTRLDRTNESVNPAKIASSGEEAVSIPNEHGNQGNVGSSGEKAIPANHEFIKQTLSLSESHYYSYQTRMASLATLDEQSYGWGAIVEANGHARAAYSNWSRPDGQPYGRGAVVEGNGRPPAA